MYTTIRQFPLTLRGVFFNPVEGLFHIYPPFLSKRFIFSPLLSSFSACLEFSVRFSFLLYICWTRRKMAWPALHGHLRGPLYKHTCENSSCSALDIVVEHQVLVPIPSSKGSKHDGLIDWIIKIDFKEMFMNTFLKTIANFDKLWFMLLACRSNH